MESSSVPYRPINEQGEGRSCWGRLCDFFAQRDEEDDKLDADPAPFLQLFRYASTGEKLLLLLGVTAAAVTGILSPSFSFIGGKIVSVYVDTKEPVGNVSFLHDVWFIALILVATGIAYIILTATEYLTLTFVAQRICARIRREFVASVMAQDAEFLGGTSTGALSNTLNSNIDRIQDGIGDKIGLFVRSVVQFLTTTTIAFYYSWQLALVVLGIGPLSALCTMIMPKALPPPLLNHGLSLQVAARPMRQSLAVGAEANGLAEEAISHLKTVAACNGQRSMVERYSSLLSRGVSIATRIGLINGVFDGLGYVIFYVFYTAGFWFGIQWFHSGIISDAGSVLIIINTTIYSSSVLIVLGPHVLAVLKARVAAAVVYEIIDRKPSFDARLDVGMDPSSLDCAIEFDDVHFSYSSRPNVLSGLSWRVREGETVALVGRSGCGKSTSISLISRLLSISSGDIRVGGVPIQQLSIRKLRKMIGVVSQEPSLFHGTIRENIHLGRDLSDEQIEAAAKTANAHDFIMALDQGYSSLLGPSGVALSGGQKQRVAIARAIASNPRILLLDEATSALDTHSERAVQAALNKASAGRTTVVVAHRLSTIKDVDRVFVMEEGKVVEDGSYGELSTRDGGVFSLMVAMQDTERKRKSMSEESEEESSGEETKTALVRRSVSQQSETVETFHKTFPSREGGVWDVLTYDKKKWAGQILIGWLRGLELILIIPMAQFSFRALATDDYMPILEIACGIMVVAGIFVSIILVISKTYSAWFSESVVSGLRISCLSSLLHRPLSYFDRAETSPAACSVTLSQQSPLVLPALDFRAASFYEQTIPSLLINIYCLFICWQNGVAASVIFVCVIIMYYILQQIVNGRTKEFNDADSTGEGALEIFGCVRTIQLMSAEGYFNAKYADKQRVMGSALGRLTRCRALVHCISQSIIYFPSAIITALGAYLVYLGDITVEQIFLSDQCVITATWAVVSMSPNLVDIIGSASAARELFALIDPSHRDGDSGAKPEIRGSLKADRVSFAYPSRPSKLVSRDLSFSVSAGKSIALVGPSGGGKSTIVNLIERFYDPSTGSISMDGHSLGLIDLRHLRSAVALVSQEPVLFMGTIADNITLGCEGESTIDDVRRACRIANAASFIEAFPQGYDTPVGEKGGLLSGGQKQRVAIARALVRNPKILLLDEATSALDSESEKVVKEALQRSVDRRTSLIVAHRLDTVRECNEILFIDHGRVVERGNHAELMATNGRYASLVREQKLS